jgi:hypothetical protein
LERKRFGRPILPPVRRAARPCLIAELRYAAATLRAVSNSASGIGIG